MPRGFLGAKPLPTKHLPDEIRKALLSARVRPVAMACFRTAGRLVMNQDVVALEYVEGWARCNGRAIAHAWVRHSTIGDVDLLLRGYALEPLLVLSRTEVIAHIANGDTWGPWEDALMGGP